MQQRFWELDALRGLAIAMMIVFHFVFDLKWLGIADIQVYQGGWLLFQRATISLFLLLVGVSLHISYSRMKDRRAGALLQKFGMRTLKLAGVAAVISLVTWLAIPSAFIVFGIIHFIAVASMVAVPFLRFEKLNLLLGLVLLVQGIFFPLPSVDTSLLLGLGFTYPGFFSVDYVPLVPWFGLVLIGIFLGKRCYPDGKRKLKIAEANSKTPILQWMGEKSLWIYLIHQPVLVGILMAGRFFLNF